MRKYIILPILLISLFCSSLYASDTTTYHITAYKQGINTPGTYSMNIYDTLHGSLEVLGQNTASETHKTDSIDLSHILGHFFYNAGEDEVDNFNEHLLFAVLSFGTTSVPKRTYNWWNSTYTNGTASITIKITVSTFYNQKDDHHIPVYIEYGNAEFEVLSTSPTKPTQNNAVSASSAIASKGKDATITQTVTFTNETYNNITVSWQDTIAFAMGINRSDYDAAPIGDYVSNVTVTMEAP